MNRLCLFFMFLTFLFHNAFAVGSILRGVYGEDNRTQANLYPNDFFKMLSKSVAALVPNENIELFYHDQLAKILGVELQQKYNLCEEESFGYNISTSFCSGFLVAPNILVTAGHCIRDEYDCTQNKWVFDYEFDRVHNAKSFHFLGKNIYSCTKVLAQEYTLSGVDYAVVKLDRYVMDRLPLQFRQSGKIKNGTNLLTIGHPLGLPKVITDGAKVIANDDETFFVTDLDSFHGNSGGPVINMGTGLVEGILARGGEDFFYDFEKECYLTYYCKLYGNCPGEDVTRMSAVKGLQFLKKI